MWYTSAMKKFFITLILIISGIGVSIASTLPERLNLIINDLLSHPSTATYNIKALKGIYPSPLLLPETLLPQSEYYPLKPLQQLYHNAISCRGPWPTNPLLTQAVYFTKAMCHGDVLPISWFAHSDYIHPGGGSYAYRYLEVHPAQYSELKRFLHIQERPLAAENSLLGRLQRMTGEEIHALIASDSAFIANNELWIRQRNEYRVYDSSTWQPILEKNHIQFTLLTKGKHCLAKSGNICWQEVKTSHLSHNLFIALVVINVLLLIGWGIYRLRRRRRDLDERMLVLQILTHELRTPIASLSMTVEGFRRHFDALPESLYDEFRRLTEDSRRLRQLAEASKDYLQANHQQLKVQQIESFNEWIEYISGPYNVTLYINEDRNAYLNLYWLGTCIDNLLSNAQKYGVAPIQLQAIFTEKKLIITVSDHGTLTAKDWAKLRKPFVSDSGLGLGLTIVESMVRRMGGRLTLQGPPTTFILEIPCESNSAIG